MYFKTLEELIVATSESVRPPERINVAEAAEKYRFIYNPGSYVGQWKNTFAPYLVEPMEVLTSLDYTGMIFVGPARCGKSDMFFNYLTHSARCDPADMMAVLMTMNVARDWSKGDLQRNMRHSPELGSRVMPGRQNNNTHDIFFKSGMRLLVKWPTITELSGKTIPRSWLMDYDRMDQDIGKEGSPYALTKVRARTFGRFGMCVAESSPGFLVDDPKWQPRTPHEAPPTKGILALYNGGDRRQWYWRCISCSQPFIPTFAMLNYPDSDDFMEAAEAATLQCPFCHTDHEHDMKKELNLCGRWLKDGQVWMPNGKIEGTGVRSDTASFWLTGIPAAFSDWKTLVLNYLKAMKEYTDTGSQESLKVTINTDQGMPFTPRGIFDDRQPEGLKARAQDIGEKVVPPGVRFLLATADVQRNRWVVQVHGFSAPSTTGIGDVTIIDRFEIRKSKRQDEDGDLLWVSPHAYIEDWHLLIQELMLKSYPLDDGSGRRMIIKLSGCDSVGLEGVTPKAYNFWRYLKNGPDKDVDFDDGYEDGLHRRFRLLRGDGLKTAPRVRIGYPDSDRKDRHAGARGEIPVLFLNSMLVKDMVSAMLDRTEPGGGCVVFPKWLPDSFYSEMLSETRTLKGWENLRKVRNESWDLLVYAMALALSRDINLENINWDDPPGWAADWDDNDLVFDDGSDRPFKSDRQDELTLEKLGQALG